jgi:hypothetical protein
VVILPVTRYITGGSIETGMAEPAERMRAMRQRRRVRALRELRLVVPDARSKSVRRRIAEQVARLDWEDEEEAMRWIEAVSEFDNNAQG